jgi:hypothetical protein
MSNPYRGPSIDVSYQVSVHLAKLFLLVGSIYGGSPIEIAHFVLIR